MLFTSIWAGFWGLAVPLTRTALGYEPDMQLCNRPVVRNRWPTSRLTHGTSVSICQATSLGLLPTPRPVRGAVLLVRDVDGDSRSGPRGMCQQQEIAWDA